MSDTYEFRIERTHEEATGHIRLVLTSASPAFAAGHTAPGQYVMVKLFAEDEKPRPLALASVPGASPEFIFRTDDPAAALALAGQTRHLSAASGAGFRLPQNGQGRDLWLIATGSAIAPIWPQLQAVLAQRSTWGAVHVLYGTRNASHICYADAWTSVRNQDVTVTHTFTDEDAALGEHQRRGRVQAHLPDTFSPGAHIVVCGHFEMMNDIAAYASAHGVDDAHIHKNF